MDQRVRTLFADRDSPDRDVAYRATIGLFEMTSVPVSWGYDVWDRMLSDLEHREGHRRAFAAQLLARLATSDPERRMLKDFPRVAAVMKDEKTVTARHTLQSLWRIALAGAEQQALVLKALEKHFADCAHEKNGRLGRTDVITALGRLAKATGEPSIEGRAEALMEAEPDEKQRKKQRAAWRKAVR
jgi:hypothetical protein